MVNEGILKEMKAKHKVLKKYLAKKPRLSDEEIKQKKLQKLFLKDQIVALEAELDKRSKTAETPLPEWAADGIGV